MTRKEREQMKTLKRIAVLALMLALVLQTATLADAAFGAAAVKAGQAYTHEEMLTYAIQDEYLAQAEYQAYQKAFGDSNTFARLERAETNHIARLEELLGTYGFVIPENTAASLVKVPETIETAYLDSVAQEMENIDMYKAFLAQKDLPDDLRLVFTALMGTSQNHLRAAMRQVENAAGLRQGRQNAQSGMMNQRGNSFQSRQAKGGMDQRRQAMQERFGSMQGQGRFNRNFQNLGPQGMQHPNCPHWQNIAEDPAADENIETAPAPEPATPGN